MRSSDAVNTDWKYMHDHVGTQQQRSAESFGGLPCGCGRPRRRKGGGGGSGMGRPPLQLQPRLDHPDGVSQQACLRRAR